MTVIILDSLNQLGRQVAKLKPGDVLAFRTWRIVLAGGNCKPFWLEGHGVVHKVARVKGAAKILRQLIKDHQ